MNSKLKVGQRIVEIVFAIRMWTYLFFYKYKFSNKKKWINREEEMAFLPAFGKQANKRFGYSSSGPKTKSNQFRQAALTPSMCVVNGFFEEKAK